MTKLYAFFGKNVKIVDVDGEVWEGYASAYTPAIDSENGEEEIAVRTKSSGLIGFYASDIRSIQVCVE